jgi:hypothetical protein
VSALVSCAFIAAAAGCTGRTPISLPSYVEPDLASQAAAVRSGEWDKIEIEHTAFTNQEFARLSGLENLRTLIIDDDSAYLTTGPLTAFANLPNLEHFRFRGGGINDAALAQIVRATSLRILNLPHAEFTDAGLASLQKLQELEQLRFGTPHVTDAGMKTIAEFPAIKRLHLINVPITDAGLAHLAAIQQLESLYIDGSNISDAAFEDLFRRRPTLHVHLNQRHHDRDPNKHEHP